MSGHYDGGGGPSNTEFVSGHTSGLSNGVGGPPNGPTNVELVSGHIKGDDDGDVGDGRPLK